MLVNILFIEKSINILFNNLPKKLFFSNWNFKVFKTFPNYFVHIVNGNIVLINSLKKNANAILSIFTPYLQHLPTTPAVFGESNKALSLTL